MKGSTHLVIGAAVGAVAGYQTQPEVMTVLADMKTLPMNRRGVKLLAPVWKKEF